MDETTKVIIATLSGFIIAFFAEPVKIYFQNKAKLRDLKVGLYKEMIGNNRLFGNAIEDPDPKFFILMLESGIRTECYKQAIGNDPVSFYRIFESETINIIHGGSIRVLNAVNQYDTDSEELPELPILTLCEGWTKNFSIVAYEGNLDKKLLKLLMHKEDYKNLMEVGKKESEKDPDPS